MGVGSLSAQSSNRVGDLELYLYQSVGDIYKNLI